MSNGTIIETPNSVATELGVSIIVPLLTDRVIVRPKTDRFEFLQKRYARIALDAAQQSERWEVPQVLPPTPIRNFFDQYCQETIKCLLVVRDQLPSLVIDLALPKGI